MNLRFKLGSLDGMHFAMAVGGLIRNDRTTRGYLYGWKEEHQERDEGAGFSLC